MKDERFPDLGFGIWDHLISDFRFPISDLPLAAAR
jgi:hypothetical protein